MQLSGPERAIFMSIARERRIAEGAELVSAQDMTDEVYLLLEGNARVVFYSGDGRSVDFAEAGPGDLLGFIAAIDGNPRTASVVARSEMRVAVAPARAFSDLLNDRAFADAIMKALILQMRGLSERVIEFSTLLARERLARELLRQTQGQNGETARLAPAPTHYDLAARISTHREAVSRELSRLAKKGIVQRQNGALLVNRAALEAALERPEI
jgi:CRP-like cAMP-binding protein